MANHNGHTPNLLPWPAGVSGNPAGGKKGKPLMTPALRRFLQMSADEIGDLLADDLRRARLNTAEAVALGLIETALRGPFERVAAIKEIFNRADGPYLKEALEDQDDSPETLRRYMSITYVEPLGLTRRD